MSYQIFFDFSSGLYRSIKAKSGTLAKIITHVKRVESALGLKTTQYRDNPKRWENTRPAAGVTDELLCRTAEGHNNFIRWLYESFVEWQEKPPADAEIITPRDAEKFWHALVMITVPAERWTGDYYRARMDSLYDVMRGRKSEGVEFDTEPLTPRQAAQVIILFAEYLDAADLRLDVPRGHDYLASSSDGGYYWCDKCGAAVAPEDFQECEKKDCPLADDLV